jgi:hypothetical protein
MWSLIPCTKGRSYSYIENVCEQDCEGNIRTWEGAVRRLNIMWRFVICSLHQTFLGPQNPGRSGGANCFRWPHCNMVLNVFGVIIELHGNLTTSPWPYKVPLRACPLVRVGFVLSPVCYFLTILRNCSNWLRYIATLQCSHLTCLYLVVCCKTCCTIPVPHLLQDSAIFPTYLKNTRFDFFFLPEDNNQD